MTTVFFPPPAIFHYTSLEAACHILRGTCHGAEDAPEAGPVIRMSNAFCLNDYKEVVGGLESIERQCEAPTHFCGPGDERGANSIADRIRTSGLYVASFSGNGDLLSQWRAYGRDGKGVSIGFRPSHLVCETPNMTWVNWHVRDDTSLTKVVYETSGQSLISTTLFKQMEEVEDWANPQDSEIQKRWRFSMILKAAAAMKNEAFSEECEYRMVHSREISTWPPWPDWQSVVSISPVQFYATIDRIVDYVELQVPRSWVRQIVLGPTCRVHEHELRRLLVGFGYQPDQVEISRSRATYMP